MNISKNFPVTTAFFFPYAVCLCTSAVVEISQVLAKQPLNQKFYLSFIKQECWTEPAKAKQWEKRAEISRKCLSPVCQQPHVDVPIRRHCILTPAFSLSHTYSLQPSTHISLTVICCYMWEHHCNSSKKNGWAWFSGKVFILIPYLVIEGFDFCFKTKRIVVDVLHVGWVGVSMPLLQWKWLCAFLLWVQI